MAARTNAGIWMTDNDLAVLQTVLRARHDICLRQPR